MRRAVAAVAVVLLAGCGASGGGDKPTAHDITGTFTIADSVNAHVDGTCEGDGGYDDIGPLTDVVISSDGKTLAVGSLGDGEWADDECTFTWRLKDVPKRDFYEVEIGDRGKLHYSYSDMVKADWSVASGLD